MSNRSNYRTDTTCISIASKIQVPGYRFRPSHRPRVRAGVVASTQPPAIVTRSRASQPTNPSLYPAVFVAKWFRSVSERPLIDSVRRAAIVFLLPLAAKEENNCRVLFVLVGNSDLSLWLSTGSLFITLICFCFVPGVAFYVHQPAGRICCVLSRSDICFSLSTLVKLFSLWWIIGWKYISVCVIRNWSLRVLDLFSA